MESLKNIYRTAVDERLRDSLWALRTRGDSFVLSAVVRGALDLRYPASSHNEHLKLAMDWLCAAQDHSDGGGVSAFYDAREGSWGPIYPETTGYIIPTFFDYAAFTSSETYRQRANLMADYLLTIQLDNGAFPIGPLWADWERVPIVFDTGQVIHGLVRAFEETSRGDCLASAKSAGDWLVEIQDQDGCWRKHTSLGHVHTFNVRTAWALLRLYEVSRQERYRSAAIQNLEWSLTQQDPDGWFCNAGFTPQEDPLTHTIAYTIEGLLESGVLLENETIIHAARLAADALRVVQKRDGYLKGRYGPGWRSNVKWSCLTGNAQMAIIWFRLYQMTGDKSYMEAGLAANHFVKRTQPRQSKQPGIAGGITGSFPIYGDYEPYRNLNWAVKFFADSLLLEKQVYPDGA